MLHTRSCARSGGDVFCSCFVSAFQFKCESENVPGGRRCESAARSGDRVRPALGRESANRWPHHRRARADTEPRCVQCSAMQSECTDELAHANRSLAVNIQVIVTLRRALFLLALRRVCVLCGVREYENMREHGKHMLDSQRRRLWQHIKSTTRTRMPMNISA